LWVPARKNLRSPGYGTITLMDASGTKAGKLAAFVSWRVATRPAVEATPGDGPDGERSGGARRGMPVRSTYGSVTNKRLSAVVTPGCPAGRGR
jgi:hypothetical protein